MEITHWRTGTAKEVSVLIKQYLHRLSIKEEILVSNHYQTF